MVIFRLIVKTEKYAETALLQVTLIVSVQILSKNARIVKGNTAQTITDALFFLIETEADHLSYQSIYGARFRSPCPKLHPMSNTTRISNDLSIVQANVNKSQNVSNSLLNDPDLE